MELFHRLRPIIGLAPGMILAPPTQPVDHLVTVGSDLATLPHDTTIVGSTFLILVFVVLVPAGLVFACARFAGARFHGELALPLSHPSEPVICDEDAPL